MDETIEQLRAGWEQVREKVKALQLSAQFYAERNQQLIDENRELKVRLDDALRNKDIITEWFSAKNELLWWVTANVSRYRHPEYSFATWATAWDIVDDACQMLATQGYTRENLEKRNG